VLQGEAGVGKSVLLDYLVEAASGCRIARAAGVESEMELPFASLHQLFLSLPDRIDDLPTLQRDSLGVAFGLRSGAPPDRFLVGVAMLDLLATVAEERGLVCVIDDAQWLDRASMQVLAFVARRLLAESVAMVFAVRSPAGDLELDGLPGLSVDGLASGDARMLLDSVAPGSLDDFVRDRIVAESSGNPLALMEFARGMTLAEVEFGFARSSARPITDRLEQEYIRQVQSLRPDAQRLLLVAAVEPVGDVAVLWRAASRLGIGADAAGPAEAAGLITFGSRTRFRHPLVRSAVCRGADVGALREAHDALADATDPGVDPDRRAWHRAHAAAAPDEAVAVELERAADRAQRRGGMVAAAAFLQRATELTPNAAARGGRAVAAARAKFHAADLDAAAELVATAELCPLNDFQRAELERLRGSWPGAGRLEEGPERLCEAAMRLGPIDAFAARGVHLSSIGMAIFRGRFGTDEALRALAVAAREGPAGSTPARTIDLLLDGLVTLVIDGYEVGFAALRRALQACEVDQGRDGFEWLWYTSVIAPEVWDDAAWDRLTAHFVELARGAGVLFPQPNTLDARARCHIYKGELAAAAAVIDEQEVICEATGTPPIRSAVLELAAWQGREATTISSCEASVNFWTSRYNGRVIGIAAYARAVLYNGLARYDTALAAAQQACEYEDVGVYGWSLVELIEAAARAGARSVAAGALARLDERARAARTDWALGLLARSRAVLDDGNGTEEGFVEAIERLTRTRMTPHLARARLVYGEWLRRQHRRVDARQQLRVAYESLTQMGIHGFAERARRELDATGERVRKRTVDTSIVLTPQEAQIARLAGQRRTNPEIAAQLFISPKTVEYHLAKVFPKLGVSSRRELPAALQKLGLATAPS
jgi:DNA-binding CsgD family transcriptional regulator